MFSCAETLDSISKFGKDGGDPYEREFKVNSNEIIHWHMK
jgi:hypothetical protein